MSFLCHRPRSLHPLIVVVLRPVARILAALMGKGVKMWWRRQPSIKQEAVLDHFRHYKYLYAGMLTMTSFFNSEILLVWPQLCITIIRVCI